MILGFSGKALSGKDVSADYLIDRYGWDKKTGFAYNLKEACSEILNLDPQLFYTQKGKEYTFESPIEVNCHLVRGIVSWMSRTHIVRIDDIDFNKMLGKLLYSPRDVLQFVGTDIMRAYSSNYHVDVVTDLLYSTEKIVVTDVRFDNEVSSILKLGGFVVRIERPVELRRISGCVNDTNHRSEVDLDGRDNWSYRIQNSGKSLDTLYKKIDTMVSVLGI